LVSDAAKHALEHALALDGTLVEPRILLAIAKEQDRNFAAAITDWRGLLDRQGGNEAWRAMVQKRIANAEAHLSGKSDADSATAPPAGAPGPNAADVSAAQDMSPADRQAMIEGMVKRLAGRLAQQGDDLAGWLQLVRAYTVLDRKDEALAALARAKTQFAGNTQAIEQLDALAAELGLKS
jgi:cytochrome c-type biogenesis protein CcmH